MANQYHDAAGRFCSRDGMLASIHQLAVSGDTNGYLELQSQFAEIDREASVVLSREEFDRLVAASSSPTFIESYSGLDEGAAEEIADSLATQVAAGDASKVDRLRAVLEANNYSNTVMYPVLKSKALPYDEASKLVLEHNNGMFYVLAQEYPEEVLSQHNQEFRSYLADVYAHGHDDMDEYVLDESASVIVEHAQSPEDVAFAESITPYGYFGGHAATNVAGSPLLSRDTALALLRRSLSNGGNDEYESVRWALTDNLNKRGFSVVPHIDPDAKVAFKPGAASEALVASVPEVDRSKWSLGEKEKVARVLRKVDSYEVNYDDLRYALKKAEKANYRHAVKRDLNAYRNEQELKRRMHAAETYLRLEQDEARVSRLLEGLDF